MVRKGIASVNDWISKCLVRIIYADLGPDTPPLAFRCSGLHFLEVLQAFLYVVISMLGSNAIEALLTHLNKNKI